MVVSLTNGVNRANGPECEATGAKGEDVRPVGRVDNPDTLTHYDPDHLYIVAMYDIPHRG